DRLSGTVVALKQVSLDAISILELTSESLPDADNLRLALTREFQIMAGLRHPNIVSVLDYGFDEEDQPFFTMTYLPDGQDLLGAAESAAFDQKIDLIKQLLQALSYLHRHGVLHRDLKPGNVLVSRGQLQVLDFGLSSPQGKSTGSGGTPLYTAPEVFEGGELRAPADLFAVGELFYQLLTGRHPFEPFDLHFYERLSEKEPAWDDIPPSLQPVIKQMLAKDPTDRFQHASDVLISLAKALDEPLPVDTVEIRESYLQAAKFVGRQTELNLLKDGLQHANRNRGSGWLIGGESGVGKSRLVRELRTRGLMRNFSVVVGQGVADGRGLPYQMWREPLRHLLITAEEVDDLTAGALAQIVPDIDRLLNRAIPRLPSLSEIIDQSRLHAAIATLVLGQSKPLLLILEDLQWADESLQVLPRIIEGLHDRPIMIAATYRREDWAKPPDSLDAMSLIELKRLSKAEISALSQLMLGEMGDRQDLVEMLYKETEGNTFFLVEMVRALGEEVGMLDQLSAADFSAEMMPQGIQAIIQRRIDQVHPDDYDLLLLASLSGRHLDLKLLSLFNKGASLNGWLTRCASATIIEIEIGERWAFSHDKIREGLAAGIAPAQREGLHHQIAQGLEQLYADQDDHASDLAYHWQQAGDEAKERPYAFRAGLLAAQQFRHADAKRFYDRVLTLTPHDALAQRLDVLIALEWIVYLLGDRKEQRQLTDTMLTLAETLKDPNYLANVHARISLLERVSGRGEEAFEHSNKALHFGTVADNKIVLADTYIELGNMLVARGHIDKALESLKQGLEISQTENNLARIAYNQTVLGAIQSTFGRYTQALAGLNSVDQLYERLGVKNWHALCVVYRSHTYCRIGQLDKAKRDIDKAHQLAQESGFEAAKNLVHMTLGDLYIALGEYKLAANYFDQALQGFVESQYIFYLCVALQGRGDVAFRMGDISTARKKYGQMLNLSNRLGDEASIAYARAGLFRARTLSGERSGETDALYSEISGYVKANPKMENMRFPLTFCLNLYHALSNDGKKKEARSFLKIGERLIREAAAQFKSQADLKAYLEQPYLVGEVLSLLAKGKVAVSESDVRP
ncbi:MAG: AAA family ATPase, partial [Chloroflexota bacterium]